MMKELLLFTQSQALANHWIASIEDDYKVIMHTSELYPAFDKSKSQIILYDMQSFASLFDIVIAEAQDAGVALFALTGLPLFEEGSMLLPAQVSGYGNAYMAKGNLLLALEVIREGKVWLYPEFIQELISQASHKPVAPRSVSTEDLTPKELEVSQLVAEGKTNKEVASALDITERTVKTHLTHIYEKLNISDRLSLALLFKV
jgi:two-component system, NarL family, nitrate/nitrite response regulator NarL